MNNTNRKLPLRVVTPLLIFSLAGGAVVSMFPKLYRTHTSPPFWLFLSVGLIMVALTGLLFSYLSKLNLGFGRTAMVLAFGYNAVIVLIKLVLAPYSLYLTNQQQSFSDQFGSPNAVFYNLAVSVAILLLYIAAFRLIYEQFAKRAAIRSGLPVAQRKQPGIGRKAAFITGVVILGLVMAGGGVILVPLLISSTLTYLGNVTGSVLLLPLVLAIGCGVLFVYRGFSAVDHEVILTRNATLLASFFWLGVSLIMIYHVLWIVFMLTLVHLWPFNTYSPK